MSLGICNGLGHLELTGVGAGGSGLTWQDDGTWVIVSEKAVNTPTEGAELHTDANAASDPNGNEADATTGWTATDATLTSDSGTKNVGSYSLKYVATAAQGQIYRDLLGLSTGSWYALSYDGRHVGGGGTQGVGFNASTSAGLALAHPFTVSQTTFTTKVYNFRYDGNYRYLIAREYSGTNDGGLYIDNLSLKPLTLSSLFSSLSLSTQDVVASADLVVTAGTQAGMVICLDSAASPANFCVCYHNGVNAILEKCVAGTYTTLISAAATYSANAPIVVHKDGTSVRLYYNNALIGAVQTVSDAGIINNKLHGIFSTYSGNTIDNFNVYARGNQGQYLNIDRY